MGKCRFSVMTLPMLTRKYNNARHHDFSKKTAVEYSFEAEEKIKIEDVKSLTLKSSALKCTIKEK